MPKTNTMGTRVKSPLKRIGDKTMTRTKKTKRIPLDVSPEQYDTITDHTAETNRNKWIREAIAEKYKRETGLDFPVDPPIGGYRPRKKSVKIDY